MVHRPSIHDGAIAHAAWSTPNRPNEKAKAHDYVYFPM